jgi:hypothetical protein
MNIYALKGHKVKCITLYASYNLEQQVEQKYYK